MCVKEEDSKMLPTAGTERMEGVVIGKNVELSAPDSHFGVWTAGE